MFDGISQQLNRAEESYSTVKFARFAYDVSPFLSKGGNRIRRPREYFVAEALAPTEAMLAHADRGEFVSEAHEKIQLPLLTLTLPLIALGGVLAGSFRRGGFGLRIAVSVGLVIVAQAIMIVSKSAVRANPDDWPLSYLPILFTIVVGGGMIAYAARTRRRAATP